LDVVKNLQVTVPFTELLAQVPTYAKFMKDVLNKKKSLLDHDTVALTEQCSAIMQNRSPTKLEDPGSFSIPCTIGTVFIEKALCDLGASVSVIPYSVCERLNMGPLKMTSVTLQMADRSVKRPIGLLEDVPVRIGKYFIPVDFVVLDIDEDVNIPIILGRPFLNTAGAVIDVGNGRLTLQIGDDKVTFNLAKALRAPMIEETSYCIDIVDDAVADTWDSPLSLDTFDVLGYDVLPAGQSSLFGRVSSWDNAVEQMHDEDQDTRADPRPIDLSPNLQGPGPDDFVSVAMLYNEDSENLDSAAGGKVDKVDIVVLELTEHPLDAKCCCGACEHRTSTEVQLGRA